MDRAEHANELMARARRLGLRVEFDSGLNVAKQPAAGDPERQGAILEELGKYISDIRPLAQGRAIAARGKDLIGHRIFSQLHGAGTLVGVADDGCLTIRISAEMRRTGDEENRSSQMNVTCDAKSVLIVVDEEETGAASSSDAGAPSERPREGFFDRFRSGSSKD